MDIIAKLRRELIEKIEQLDTQILSGQLPTLEAYHAQTQLRASYIGMLETIKEVVADDDREQDEETGS